MMIWILNNVLNAPVKEQIQKRVCNSLNASLPNKFEHTFVRFTSCQFELAQEIAEVSAGISVLFQRTSKK